MGAAVWFQSGGRERCYGLDFTWNPEQSFHEGVRGGRLDDAYNVTMHLSVYGVYALKL